MTEPRPRVAVVVFPGSNDDRDAAWALHALGAEPMLLWHGDADLPSDVGVVVLPGGFSYGDYLRCGAIALAGDGGRRPLRRRGRTGARHLQRLPDPVRSRPPPGVLRPNHSLEFVCADTTIRVEGATTPLTARCTEGQRLVIPVKHGEGAWFADDELYRELVDVDQIVFRYEEDVNGAMHSVAGVCNRAGTSSA